MIGRRIFCGCAAAALSSHLVHAQAGPPPTSAGPADPALLEDLVTANRILFDQGVVDGFGHVSARHDKDPNRFLLSRSMAPGLVTAADILELDLDGVIVDARGRNSYLERFIHAEIYRLRPDVGSVVHSSGANKATNSTMASSSPPAKMAGWRRMKVRTAPRARTGGSTSGSVGAATTHGAAAAVGGRTSETALSSVSSGRTRCRGDRRPG